MHFGIFGIETPAGLFAIAMLGYFCWEFASRASYIQLLVVFAIVCVSFYVDTSIH
ncbi:MAG TPA: hypothetical protein VJT80_13090 [Steroidobacteraceae bacterium]|nr:hypothetical protein [Steroidobacteraceae bacterium]